jgi:aminoglycoside phosphotransferase (APT) family kinase protein
MDVTADAIASYLGSRLPGIPDVHVDGLRRIVGGASRITYSFDAEWTERGQRVHRGLIVRLDPVASLLDTDRELEFAVYRGLSGSEIPVPEALWLEPGRDALGAPFFVLERIDGCETAPHRMFREPYASVLDRLGERLFEIGGLISGFDWQAAGWDFLDVPTPTDCWQRELDHWSTIIEEQRSDAQPIVRAAIDWLRRHPAPPAQRVVVVHGDYRTGNVLYDEGGEIQGVLDWEMCHLGDPLEDLAWTCMFNWRWGRELAGGVIEVETGHRIWERTSGFSVDAEAYHWWQVFSHVKAQGIWLTGARNFADGKTDETMLAGIAATLLPVEDRQLIELLGWAEE